MANEPATGSSPARKPGQYGREILRRNVWRWIAVLVLLIALQLIGLLVGWHGVVPDLVELAVIAFILLGNRIVTPGLDRRLRGVLGEQKVGEILDGLAPQGWLTIHDASTGHGNIDHIAIGPAGILTIETKSHRGRIPTSRINQRWLAQAYAEAKGLEELIGAPAKPLLVFSDAYLVGKPVSRQRGVVVLPARMLARHLASRKRILTTDEVNATHAHVLSRLDGI